ncbi:MAG: efflux RND transporter permease subunit [Porticoccaceae bacterium]
MPHFFIDRPVFAWVVALFIILAGVLAIPNLPIAQYPTVAPPSVEISATYPGASTEVVDETVTSLIEQELNGATGLLYFDAQSNAYGRARITATFVPGTNPDLAAVEVQNSIKRVESRLPQAVIQRGIEVQKASTNFLLLIAISSPDGSVDRPSLGDYVARNILSEIKRIPGVGRAQMWSSERAMRVWVDPTKLVGYGLSMDDVNRAIGAQNVQVPAGAIGDMPAPESQTVSAAVIMRGMMETPEEFGRIMLRANPDGSAVRLADVAQISLGVESYQFSSRLNGKPTVAIPVQLAPGANALETANAIYTKMEELEQYFPEGVSWSVPYDTAPFVKASIEKVIYTLFEAMILVFIVMFLFLQNIRYTLIPSIVVPIALLGTFAVMLVAGFSINMLTMFGMVLAIGILVDDAIVVVENVERLMVEEGLSPREATRKAMTQITGAIVGITLVLSAVFLPLAFMSGSVGVIYRQFSLALATSILFSGFLALSLTPALCASLLKPVAAGHHEQKTGFFAWFNRIFARATRRYSGTVTAMVGKKRYMAVYGLILLIMAALYVRLPTAFLPDEDKGFVVTEIVLPGGATAHRTLAGIKQLEEHYMSRPGVEDITAIQGFSFSGMGQNVALAFITFKDWAERTTSAMEEQLIAYRALDKSIRDGELTFINPPAIPELGNSSGFNLRLQDRGSAGHAALLAAKDMVLAMAQESSVVMDVSMEGLEDAPQLEVDVDRAQADALGVAFPAIANTLSAALGSATVNDFTNLGRIQRVMVQADASFRMTPEDVLELTVPNIQGEPVPLSSLAQVSWSKGPVMLARYNGYPAIRINGEASPGYSSGEAMAEMQRIMADLPRGIGYEWTGQSLQERISGNQAPMLLALSILVVVLVLAALYESWSIPLAVILVVPLGVIGSLMAVLIAGLSNDVFFKVGLVTIIGLSAKNAILIVEFARDLHAQGHSLQSAAIEAARLRFRPIIMTSLAFILGVVPLAIATGASAASQQAIGIGVMGGMISATLLAVFFVPVFFVFVLSLSRKASPSETR